MESFRIYQKGHIDVEDGKMTWQGAIGMFMFFALCVAVIGSIVRGCYLESRAVYYLRCDGNLISASQQPWIFEAGSWQAGTDVTYSPKAGEICRLTREVK